MQIITPFENVRPLVKLDDKGPWYRFGSSACHPATFKQKLGMFT